MIFISLFIVLPNDSKPSIYSLVYLFASYLHDQDALTLRHSSFKRHTIPYSLYVWNKKNVVSWDSIIKIKLNVCTFLDNESDVKPYSNDNAFWIYWVYATCLAYIHYYIWNKNYELVVL